MGKWSRETGVANFANSTRARDQNILASDNISRSRVVLSQRYKFLHVAQGMRRTYLENRVSLFDLVLALVMILQATANGARDDARSKAQAEDLHQRPVLWPP